MAGESYEGGPTRGGKWGCGAATLVGVPLFAFLILLDSLGDCAPDANCHKGAITMVILPTLAIAGSVGLLVRFLVNRFTPSR